MRAIESLDERRWHDVPADGVETVRAHSISYVRLQFRFLHVTVQLNECMTGLDTRVGDVVPHGGDERLVRDLRAPRGLEEIVIGGVVVEEEGEVPVGGEGAWHACWRRAAWGGMGFKDSRGKMT